MKFLTGSRCLAVSLPSRNPGICRQPHLPDWRAKSEVTRFEKLIVRVVGLSPGPHSRQCSLRPAAPTPD